MMFKAITLLALAALAAAEKNPTVVSPQAITYNAGEVMEIKWDGAETGFVNLDVVGENGVLPFPMMIAAGVPAKAGSYKWQIPAELKSASNYLVRVWGDHQPTGPSDGLSNKFTVVNDVPNAVNTFLVQSPNAKNPCYAGKPCEIKWNYSQNGMYPAMVDLALYKVGHPEPIAHIGTVSSSLKGYTWNVPEDANLMSGEVYISVSGSGVPLAGPGMSNDMGGNSAAFAVSQPAADNGLELEKEKEKKKDQEKKKRLPPKKPMEPKLEGKSAKSAAASQVAATAGVVSTMLVLTLASLLF